MKAFLSLSARRVGVTFTYLLTVLGALFMAPSAFAAAAPKAANSMAMMAHHAIGEDSLVVPTAEFAKQTFWACPGSRC